MPGITWLAQLLVIIGAINWGLIALFNFNLVGALFGGQTLIARIVYALIGISGLIAISLLAGARGQNRQKAR